MKKILGKPFFERKTSLVAKDLLGKYLVREVKGNIKAYKITEVEGYIGPHDLACHAKGGKTERNQVMFKGAGTIYVYFTYGMHFMLNIVTEKEDYPAAVLIRGVENIVGPGRLTKALNINKKLNDLPLSKKSGMWIEDRGEIVGKSQIISTPRIGINSAGDIWKNKKLRFLINKS